MACELELGLSERLLANGCRGWILFVMVTTCVVFVNQPQHLMCEVARNGTLCSRDISVYSRRRTLELNSLGTVDDARAKPGGRGRGGGNDDDHSVDVGNDVVQKYP